MSIEDRVVSDNVVEEWTEEEADRLGFVRCPGCDRWVRDRGIDILYHVMTEVYGG